MVYYFLLRCDSKPSEAQIKLYNRYLQLLGWDEGTAKRYMESKRYTLAKRPYEVGERAFGLMGQRSQTNRGASQWMQGPELGRRRHKS
jgi:hypothetical protein